MTAPSKRIRHYKAVQKLVGQYYLHGVCAAIERVTKTSAPPFTIEQRMLRDELTEEFNKTFRPESPTHAFWMGETSRGPDGPGNQRRIRALAALIDTLGTDPKKRSNAKARIKRIVAEVDAYNRKLIFA